MDEHVYLICGSEIESAERMARADFMIRVRQWSNGTLYVDPKMADKWWPTTKEYKKMWEELNDKE